MEGNFGSKYSIPSYRCLSVSDQYGALNLRMPKKCSTPYLDTLPNDSLEKERLLIIHRWFESECQYKSSRHSGAGRNGLVLLGTKGSRMLDFCHLMVKDYEPEKIVYINKPSFPKKIFENQARAQLTIIDGYKHKKKDSQIPIWIQDLCGGLCTDLPAKYEGQLPAIVLCYEEDPKSRDLYYCMMESKQLGDYCYYVDVSDLCLI